MKNNGIIKRNASLSVSDLYPSMFRDVAKVTDHVKMEESQVNQTNTLEDITVTSQKESKMGMWVFAILVFVIVTNWR